jgi:hypothetical protein
MNLQTTLQELIKIKAVDPNEILNFAVTNSDFELADLLLDTYADDITITDSRSSCKLGIYDAIRYNYTRVFYQYFKIEEIQDWEFRGLTEIVAGYGTVDMMQFMVDHPQFKLNPETVNWYGIKETICHDTAFIEACDESNQPVIDFLLQHPKTAAAAKQDTKKYGFYCFIYNDNITMINRLLDDPDFKPKRKARDCNGNSRHFGPNVLSIKDHNTRQRLCNDPRTKPSTEDIYEFIKDRSWDHKKGTHLMINALNDGIVTPKEILTSRAFSRIWCNEDCEPIRNWLLKNDFDINNFGTGMLTFYESKFTKQILKIEQPNLSINKPTLQEQTNDKTIKDQREYWTYILSNYDNIPIEIISLIKDKRLNKIAYVIKNKKDRIKYIKNPRLRIETEKAKQASILSEVLA